MLIITKTVPSGKLLQNYGLNMFKSPFVVGKSRISLAFTGYLQLRKLCLPCFSVSSSPRIQACNTMVERCFRSALILGTTGKSPETAKTTERWWESSQSYIQYDAERKKRLLESSFSANPEAAWLKHLGVSKCWPIPGDVVYCRLALEEDVWEA